MAALHPDRNFSTIANQARAAAVVLAQLEHAKVGALLAGDSARRALFCDSDRPVGMEPLEVRRTLRVQADGALVADELRPWLKAPRSADAPLRVVVNEGAGPYLARPCQMGAEVVVEDLRDLFGREVGALAFVGARTDEALAKFFEAACIEGRNTQVCHAADAAASNEAERVLGILLPQLAMITQARCDRALVAAQYLAHHPRVADVRYPGLQDDPANSEARRSLEHGFGWRVAFKLPCDSCGFAHGLWEEPMGFLASRVEQRADGLCVLHAGLEEALDVVGALEKGIACGDMADPRA